MKKIPICTADILKEVKSQQAKKLKYLTPPDKLEFRVELVCPDDLYLKINDDAKLAALIFDDTGNIYKKTVTKIVQLGVTADEAARKSRSKRDAIRKKWAVDCEFALKSAEKEMFAACTKRIDAWKKTRNDRTKYVIKSTVKVTVGALGVTTAVVGTVVAVPAGGFGAIVGIIGLAKAISNLAQEVYKLATGLDKAEKRLRQHLDTLIVQYKDASKGKVVRDELIAAALKQITTKGKASISICETEYASFHGKLTGIDIKSSDMSKKLNQLVDQQGQLAKDIDTKLIKQLASANYTSKKLPKLEKSLKKLEKTTDTQVKKTIEITKRVIGATKRDAAYAKSLKGLKSKKPQWVQYAEMSMKLIDVGFAAGATDFSAAEQIIVLVDTIGVEIDDVLTETVL